VLLDTAPVHRECPPLAGVPFSCSCQTTEQEPCQITQREWRANNLCSLLRARDKSASDAIAKRHRMHRVSIIDIATLRAKNLVRSDCLASVSQHSIENYLKTALHGE
jgi:hypothetical protein